MRVPGFFVFLEVVLPPTRVSPSILMCSGADWPDYRSTLQRGPVRLYHAATSMMPNGHMRSCAGRGAKATVESIISVCLETRWLVHGFYFPERYVGLSESGRLVSRHRILPSSCGERPGPTTETPRRKLFTHRFKTQNFIF